MRMRRSISLLIVVLLLSFTSASAFCGARCTGASMASHAAKAMPMASAGPSCCARAGHAFQAPCAHGLCVLAVDQQLRRVPTLTGSLELVPVASWPFPMGMGSTLHHAPVLVRGAPPPPVASPVQLGTLLRI